MAIGWKSLALVVCATLAHSQSLDPVAADVSAIQQPIHAEGDCVRELEQAFPE